MGFWRREDDLERELRASRPEPRRELVDDIARMVGASRSRSSRPARIGVAVALSAAMLATLGAFGGLSYAANGVTHAVSSAVHVVTPAAKPVKFIPAPAVSSSQAQYKVAMCFHGHTLNVDSHAEGALTAAGATPGPCTGGAFQPSTKLVVACLRGHNISIAKSAADTKKERQKLKSAGITLGFCKA
jgi:hypothetical protein